MAANLTELQQRIEAIAGQSLTTTEGDDDWNLRRSYLNRAQLDWAERFEWPQLYKEVNSLTSTGSALASIALPTDFRKLAGYPKFAVPNVTNSEYPEVDPTERDRFLSSDKYVYKLGDPNSGYNLIVNPASFASGTSIFINYYATPASLVSGSNVSMCPNPNYLVQQALYYYFQANEDARFQDSRAEAEKILATMLEFENVRGVGYHNQIPNVDFTKHNHRWGRD